MGRRFVELEPGTTEGNSCSRGLFGLHAGFRPVVPRSHRPAAIPRPDSGANGFGDSPTLCRGGASVKIERHHDRPPVSVGEFGDPLGEDAVRLATARPSAAPTGIGAPTCGASTRGSPGRLVTLRHGLHHRGGPGQRFPGCPHARGAGLPGDGPRRLAAQGEPADGLLAGKRGHVGWSRGRCRTDDGWAPANNASWRHRLSLKLPGGTSNRQ